MTDHPNAAAAREALEAFVRGDDEHVVALVHLRVRNADGAGYDQP